MSRAGLRGLVATKWQRSLPSELFPGGGELRSELCTSGIAQAGLERGGDSRTRVAGERGGLGEREPGCKGDRDERVTQIV